MLRRWWASGVPQLSVVTAITLAFFTCDAILTTRGSIRREGNTYVTDMRTLSGFEMSQTDATNDDIPEACRKMDGKCVRVTGQMWCANTSDQRVKHFEMIYSVNGCCFTGPPKIQHLLEATVANGGDVPYYINKPVNVTGILHVGIHRNNGEIESIYRLDVQDVQPQSS
jgi:hypothetical protein